MERGKPTAQARWGRYSLYVQDHLPGIHMEAEHLWFLVQGAKFRTAHVDRAAANRLGRLFTFEDMMGVSRAAQ
jgi:hypothetical protein